MATTIPTISFDEFIAQLDHYLERIKNGEEFTLVSPIWGEFLMVPRGNQVEEAVRDMMDDLQMLTNLFNEKMDKARKWDKLESVIDGQRAGCKINDEDNPPSEEEIKRTRKKLRK